MIPSEGNEINISKHMLLDTLSMSKKLQSAGFKPKQVEVQIEMYKDLFLSHVVTKQDLLQMEERTSQKFDKIDERFAKIDERFAKIDERFAKIDERFAKIDERFDKIDERFDKNDEKFARIDERFSRIDERFAEVNEKIEKSKNSILTWIIPFLTGQTVFLFGMGFKLFILK